jgi:hypothetical protein
MYLLYLQYKKINITAPAIAGMAVAPNEAYEMYKDGNNMNRSVILRSAASQCVDAFVR